jgi:hypothetical protein
MESGEPDEIVGLVGRERDTVSLRRSVDGGFDDGFVEHASVVRNIRHESAVFSDGLHGRRGCSVLHRPTRRWCADGLVRLGMNRERGSAFAGELLRKRGEFSRRWFLRIPSDVFARIGTRGDVEVIAVHPIDRDIMRCLRTRASFYGDRRVAQLVSCCPVLHGCIIPQPLRFCQDVSTFASASAKSGFHLFSLSGAKRPVPAADVPVFV